MQLDLYVALDALPVVESVTQPVEPRATKPAKTFIKAPKDEQRGERRLMVKDGITYEYYDMTRICDGMTMLVDLSSAQGTAMKYERLTGDSELANELRAVCDKMRKRLKGDK